jgi:hypothetical protein
VHLLPMGVGVLAFDAAGSGLSDGDWVTLGAREAEDLACVVRHLRASGAVSTLAVWGRSMGAVTALLFAAADADAQEEAGAAASANGNGNDSSSASASAGRLCAVVCDSPFARLSDLVLEIVRSQKLPVPPVLLKGALALMRGTVRRKAGFDLREASPLDAVPRCRVPCVFGHALADSFIPVSHSERLAAAYGAGVAAAGASASMSASSSAGGTAPTAPPAAAPPRPYRNLIRFGGDHNHVRPPFFYASVCCFLHVHLRLDDVLVGGNPLRGVACAAAAMQQQQQRERERRQKQQQQGRRPEEADGGRESGGAFSRGNSAMLPDDVVAVAAAPAAPAAKRRPGSNTPGSGSPSTLRRWFSRTASVGSRGRLGGADSPQVQAQQRPPPAPATTVAAAATATATATALAPPPPALGPSAAVSDDAAAAAAAEAAIRAFESPSPEPAAGLGGVLLQGQPSGGVERSGAFTSRSGRDDALPGQGLDPHQQLAAAIHHAVAPTLDGARQHHHGQQQQQQHPRPSGEGQEEEEEGGDAAFQRQLTAAIEQSLREAGSSQSDDAAMLQRVLALSLQQEQQQQQKEASPPAA